MQHTVDPDWLRLLSGGKDLEIIKDSFRIDVVFPHLTTGRSMNSFRIDVVFPQLTMKKVLHVIVVHM